MYSMLYNYKKIKRDVSLIVKKASQKNNHFGEGVWDYHILAVIKHSQKLGKMFKADLEVLELAAILHDYAGIKDYKLYPEHHVHSGELAERLLKKYNYPQEKIEHVKECIFSHRGSVIMRRRTIEAKILASADAMAHITEIADMFHLVFKIYNYETAEGSLWLKKKLQRSWAKTMPTGKDLVRDDYRAAMKIINKALISKK